MLSQTTEYALRAIVFLARGPGVAHTAQEVAEATGVSPSYMAKVLHTLVTGGLVRSQRGVHGGFMLAGSADRVTVLEVINLFEPIPPDRDSAGSSGSADTGMLDLLKSRIEQAVHDIRRVFGRTTIGQLVRESDSFDARCSGMLGDGQKCGGSGSILRPGRSRAAGGKEASGASGASGGSGGSGDSGGAGDAGGARGSGNGRTGAAAPEERACNRQLPGRSRQADRGRRWA